MFKKVISLILILGAMSALSAFAAEVRLSEHDKMILETDLGAVYTEFINGNATPLTSRVHPSLIKFVGGPERYQQVLEYSLQQMEDLEASISDVRLDVPDFGYLAGDEIVVFVDRKSVLTIGAERFSSIGYMLAISNHELRKWTYLDGAGFDGKNELLWQLLPRLPRNVRLPAQYLEEIK